MSGEVTIVGVYDADGSLTGEIRYWIGARLGRTHCSLCEITHGTFREKQSWKDCRAGLDVDVVTYHRDDAPIDVLEVCGQDLPAVVLRTQTGVELLLGPERLEECGGDVDAFRTALVSSCAERGFTI